MPEVQAFTAVPEVYPTVWLCPTGESDDDGVPVEGCGQLTDDDAKVDHGVVNIQPDCLHSLMDD